MKANKLLLPMNLQFFASDIGANGGTDGGNTDPNSTGETNTNTGDQNQNTNANTDGGKDGEKTFTQEDLNRVGKQEKESGKKAAYKALGFEDEKSAKAEMEAYKAWKDSQKTEQEKQIEALGEANQKASQAEQRALRAEAKVAALTLGANPEGLDDLITLALTKVTDDKDLVTVMTEMQGNKTFSSFFVKTENEEENSKGKGTGNNVGTQSQGSNGGAGNSLAARLAAKGTNSGKKSSYFTR